MPMKVAVIGRSATPGSFASAITMAFGELGHDTTTLELRMLGESRYRRLANITRTARENVVSRSPRAVRTLYGALLRELRDARPDLILTTLGRVTREEVDSWREVAPGVPVVLWFPDALSNFGRQQAFGAGFDRIFVKDLFLVDWLRVRGNIGELRYLAQGAPPDGIAWAEGNPTPQRSPSLVMAGNIYPSRVRFLDAVIDELPIDLYGSLHNDAVPEKIARRFTGKYLSGPEKYQVFRDARGVLNNLHYAEVGGVNYRLFQATCCRGVALIDDVPQVKRYFEPGSEVITFSSPQDLVRTMEEVTDDELNAIGEAAHARTVRDHLMRHRVQELLDDLTIA